jgi:hypothetical protein
MCGADREKRIAQRLGRSKGGEFVKCCNNDHGRQIRRCAAPLKP